MSTIVSSFIMLSNIQIDGRYIVIESFSDSSNNQYQLSYMAEHNTNQSAKLASHALSLGSMIASVP